MSRHKDVVAVYNNLVRQMTHNIGKTIDIVSPYDTDNVVVSDFYVTPNAYTRILKRRNSLIGEDK